MLVVGENLHGLIKNSKLCSEDAFGGSSISLSLCRTIYQPREDIGRVIRYNQQDVQDVYEKRYLDAGVLLLKLSEVVLACSVQKIQMPKDYFCLIQIKGTLARLFIAVSVCNGQIDPGFNGRITLEVVNLSPFKMRFLLMRK